MKRIFKLPALLAWGCWLLFAQNIRAQVCDNLAMDFDGDADFISLNTSGTAVSGDADFTVECWFSIASPLANCGNNFRRLITLAGTSTPASRFELGECNGQLKLFWSATNGTVIQGNPPFVIATISAALSADCHHIAIVRNGPNLNIYLDGANTPIYSGLLGGPLNTDLFRVGHWGGGTTLGQDWLGTVDEVRLWSVVRSIQQIKDYKDCSLSGTSTGLVANWTFDQGPAVTPGGTNTGSVALDMSGNGNNGTFSTGVANGFALNGSNSNFVCNTCARYLVEIDDQITQFPSSLFSICAGDKVHFCVTDLNNNPLSLPVGSTVTWESSENNAPFAPDPDLSAYPYAANALCFGVKKGIITSPACNSIGPGYSDRKYRAKIQKISGPPGQQEICTFYTEEEMLRICCPPTGGTIQLVPNIPTPWCEGDFVSMSVFLNPSDPWLPFGPDVTVDWCLVEGNNVTPLPQYQNQLAFNNLQVVVGTDDICLQAKIYHCSCPPVTVTQCVSVDPIPVCGTIDVVSNPPGPITQIAPYQYVICPGGFTTLEITSPFSHCTPVWQYHFGPPVPAQNSPGWTDMGTSNSTQNTNTLPALDPLDPAVWPSWATCIYYRIECRPESYPNSGCDPCYSNNVEICLEPSPPSGTISGLTQYCENAPFPTLTITPDVPGNWEYCWFWNGILEFTSPVPGYTINKPGCYWVGIKNDCETTMVGPYCVEECTIVPIVKCPSDNPCACDGLPITLDGCDSYDSCNALPLSYSWLALPSGNTGTGCTFTDTPDPGGTTYYLTVTNALGCSATSKPLTIKPCN